MSQASNLADTVRRNVSDHPYLVAAAGGAIIAAAGSFLAIRQRIKLDRLEKATAEDVEEQIKTGAIAY